MISEQILGSVFGRTDFLRILNFGPPDFSAVLGRRICSRILSPDILSFLWEKRAQKNPPGKSPTKSPKFYTTKIPDNFLQRASPTKRMMWPYLQNKSQRPVWRVAGSLARELTCKGLRRAQMDYQVETLPCQPEGLGSSDGGRGLIAEANLQMFRP